MKFPPADRPQTHQTLHASLRAATSPALLPALHLLARQRRIHRRQTQAIDDLAHQRVLVRIAHAIGQYDAPEFLDDRNALFMRDRCA